MMAVLPSSLRDLKTLSSTGGLGLRIETRPFAPFVPFVPLEAIFSDSSFSNFVTRKMFQCTVKVDGILCEVL